MDLPCNILTHSTLRGWWNGHYWHQPEIFQPVVSVLFSHFLFGQIKIATDLRCNDLNTQHSSWLRLRKMKKPMAKMVLHPWQMFAIIQILPALSLFPFLASEGLQTQTMHLGVIKRGNRFLWVRGAVFASYSEFIQLSFLFHFSHMPQQS